MERSGFKYQFTFCLYHLDPKRLLTCERDLKKKTIPNKTKTLEGPEGIGWATPMTSSEYDCGNAADRLSLERSKALAF